jgi:hypothetical protein
MVQHVAGGMAEAGAVARVLLKRGEFPKRNYSEPKKEKNNCEKKCENKLCVGV